MSAWNSYGSLARSQFSATQEYVDELAGKVFNLQPIDDTVTFDIDQYLLTPLELPTAPTVPTDLTFTAPATPTPPVIDPTYDYRMIEAPAFDVTPLTLNLPLPPDELSVQPPSTPPDISDITIPDAPTIVLPDVPTLRSITLPDLPDDLIVPEWTGTVPEFNITAPSGDFVWTETPYSSTLLDELTAKISEWLDGGTGLPDAIWTMIWDRVLRGNQRLTRRAEMEAAEEWSSRGFSVPPGALNAALRRVRQDALDLNAERLREIAIEAAKMEVDNLRFAVTQGIALEQMLGNLFNASQQRAFEAARATVDVAIALFNAQVSLYNARIQGYIGEAQVYKSRIDATLVYLEAYKAQLEGQKLIGDLNIQDVQIYTARLDAVTKAIEVYKAQLEGVRTQVDVDRNRIESFRALVQVFSEQVNAKQLEYQGYQAQMQGEYTKAQIYQAEVNAFATRMNGFVSEQQAWSTYLQSQISIKEFDLKLYASQLDGFKSLISAEAERLRASVSAFDGEVRLYQAQGEMQKVNADVQTRVYDLQLKEALARVDVRIKQIDRDIAELDRILKLEMEADRLVLGTSAQLTASALSAVNIAAQVSDTTATQFASHCSVSY
jgi:hypothetical protein